MPIELQNALIIVAGFIVWAAIDYVIVKHINPWRKSRKPKPRGATAI